MAAETGEHERIAALFRRADGQVKFARWGRPMAPVIIGTDDRGVLIFEDALATVARIAGLEMVELDPELGANFVVVFVKEWAELTAVPHLEKIVPHIAELTGTLAGGSSNQCRLFGMDEAGAIRVCVTLLRYDAALRQVSAQTLALTQAFLGMLLWAEHAFDAERPVALLPGSGRCVLKPWHARLLQAAYDPTIPAAGGGPGLALRLAARMAVQEGG